MTPSVTLTPLPQTFAVCRLSPQAALPSWATCGQFFAITRTDKELSIVCDQANIPEERVDNFRCEGNWRSLKVLGPLDFSLTGILSAIAAPLAAAKISIFALSTYDTDYVLVKAANLDQAIAVLKAAHHQIQS
ncbi:MAG: ACT domain-containing protein [Cyanobacteria bacterium P01_H01_bin.119]